MKAFKQALQQQHLVLSLGLGLFILLAGSVSLTSAWMMSVALLLNLFLSTSILYVLRKQFQEENKWILIMIVMASVGTLIQMLAVAYVPGWVQGIDNLLPFIAISGLILARVETVVMTDRYQDILFNTLGSVVGFAALVVPIGFLADLFGLGMIQFANPSTISSMLFSFEILDVPYRMPIFQGSDGAIGLLLLASLWIALVQRLRGTQA
ncbi:MAG: Rnf-Nqr subunit, rane protein [Bacillota bacterium]|jgi:Na+-translocating ferredoxin:NAD+ oxidoreductase RnfE subunit